MAKYRVGIKEVKTVYYEVEADTPEAAYAAAEAQNGTESTEVAPEWYGLLREFVPVWDAEDEIAFAVEELPER